MFSGTIQSIKIENFDEWAKDGAFYWTELQKNLRAFYSYYFKSFRLSFVYFYFSLWYISMTSNRAATFNKRLFRLLRLNRVQHLKSIIWTPIYETKHWTSVVYLFTIFCPNSVEAPKSTAKNQKRDSRTRFQAKPKTFRKQLRIICTFVPFTILNKIHKYQRTAINYQVQVVSDADSAQ